MKQVIYISGSITDNATGLPREGWQKEFMEAEERLKAMGFGVINPVEICAKVNLEVKKILGTTKKPSTAYLNENFINNNN